MNTEERLQLVLQQPAINELNANVVSDKMVDIISQCAMLMGFKVPEPRELTLMAGKVTADLYESYPFLRLGEISICFELGAKGQFGEYFGLNWRTITKWLRGYQQCDLRYRAKLAVEAEKKALPPVSEAYNLQAENRFLQNSFRRYKESGSMERVMSVRVYQTLQERGIIHNTREEKYHAISLFERWKPASGAWMPEEMRQSRIKTLAQEWLLKQYFDSIEELKLAG